MTMQKSILALLHEYPEGTTVSELTNRLGGKRGTVSTICSRMAMYNMIKAEKRNVNGRAILVLRLKGQAT